MIEKLTSYRTSDGTTFDSEVAARKHENEMAGRPHICPKCKGSGFVPTLTVEKTIRDYESEAFYGFFSGPQYKKIVVANETLCLLCNGHGYNELLEILQQKVVGYGE